MSPHPRHRRDARRPTARRLSAVLGAALALALGSAGVVTSQASWNDREYVKGDTAAINCTDANSGASAGSGRLIGGTLGSLDLDAAVALKGMTVTNTGTAATPDPATATSLGSNAYANPFAVSALSTINASMSPLLALPGGVDTGVLNQYARAGADTTSAGAAGAVSNSGAISLTQRAPGASMPTFATLQLGTLVQNVLGSPVSSLVTGLTDAQLKFGAVASSAQLSGCTALWHGIYTALVRQYALAGMDAVLTSPTVSALSTTTTSAVTTLQGQIAAVSGSTGLTTALASAILTTLGPSLGALGVGTPTVTATLTPNFSAVTSLLTGTISDPSGLATISPSTGTVTVDLGALVGPAYLGSPQINGLAPNSRLLLNATAVNALKTALTTALATWTASVVAAVNTALSAVVVNVKLTAPVSLTVSVLGIPTVFNVGTLVVQTTAGLDTLLAGTATVDVHIDQTSGLCSTAIVGALLCSTLNGIVGGLTPAVATLVGKSIGTTVQTALAGTAATVTALSTNLGTASSNLVTFLGTSLAGLFGSSGLAQLWVNVQNKPDPAAADAGPEPSWAAGLPGPTTNPYGTGRYDEAALRLTILNAAPAVGLDLARSSVGSNTAVG